MLRSSTLESATASIRFPSRQLNSRPRCTGMKAWRMTPQIAGCASRSKASSVRNPGPRSTLRELRREPHAADPARREGRVDETKGSDRFYEDPRKFCIPDRAGLLSRLGRKERLPNPAEVLLSEVKERVRNPRPGYKSLDRSEEVERQPK